jgi:hypothetical protein
MTLNGQWHQGTLKLASFHCHSSRLQSGLVLSSHKDKRTCLALLHYKLRGINLPEAILKKDFRANLFYDPFIAIHRTSDDSFESTAKIVEINALWFSIGRVVPTQEAVGEN